MKTFLLFFSVFLAVSAISSCATIITGTHQRIKLVSSQPGAEVWVDGSFKDSTPCTVKVKRTWDNPQEIRLVKPGYRDENVELTKKFNEITTLNFINIFGWALDGATAACIRYAVPDTIILIPKKKSH